MGKSLCRTLYTHDTCRFLAGEVSLRVTKFYRPEDTFRGAEGSVHNDLHMLYYSGEGTVALVYLPSFVPPSCCSFTLLLFSPP